MNPLETLTIDHGLTVRIYHDDGAAQPFEDDDAVRIVVLHRRYIDPSAGACGRCPAAIAVWTRENEADWYTIPLFMLDHGGTIYRACQTNPFSCAWDSGRAGIIALKRAQWGNGSESNARLAAYAAAVAEIYTSWANGECFGYRLFDREGAELDACWGFIGLDVVRAEAKSAARAHAPSKDLLSHGKAGAP